jgi:UDPglucose 6-dehydrogenase
LLWDAVPGCAYDPEASEEAQWISASAMTWCCAIRHGPRWSTPMRWSWLRSGSSSSPDFQRLSVAGDRVIFDGRNLYHPDEVEAAGLA